MKKTLLFALALCLMAPMAAHSLQSYPGREIAIMEILFLNEGQTREDAEAYFAKASKVAERYGARDAAGAYLKRWIRGGKDGIYDADFVVVTIFPNAQKMNDLMQRDEDYAELAYTRDEIFDRGQTISFMVDPITLPGQRE
ncbi:MAG: hypothetical protein ACQES2_09910 [Pseudomonadota bacterium]